MASGIIIPFTLSCRSGEAGRQNQGGAGGIISPACLFCLSAFPLFLPFPLPGVTGGGGAWYTVGALREGRE